MFLPQEQMKIIQKDYFELTKVSNWIIICS